MLQLKGKKTQQQHQHQLYAKDPKRGQTDSWRGKQRLLSLDRECLGSPLFPSRENVKLKLQDFINFWQIQNPRKQIIVSRNLTSLYTNRAQEGELIRNAQTLCQEKDISFLLVLLLFSLYRKKATKGQFRLQILMIILF